jgi:cellulose synthase/poly-beta-1,6-N-acetylglucosamine synthase-like glycosyltransferase
MILRHVVLVAGWGFLAYFLALQACYVSLLGMAAFRLRRELEDATLDRFPRMRSGFEQPVTIVVPAYNEAANIAASLRSLLQLEYPAYEIIVVNDGSTDGTLETLIREFALVPFPEAYRLRLPVKPIRGVYRASAHPNLRVLDKENGGKADALNAGINAARYPLFCSLDADSILQRDSLDRIVKPFLDDPTVIAAGGTVRPANGCQVQGGFLTRTGLPLNPLALLQVVEYMRSFLFGRLGWSQINGMLVISGAFGVFHKETVVAAGGYRTNTIGEDMELVVRLHRLQRKAGRQYRIAQVPEATCWTEVPESVRVLRSQRVRWQRGLGDSLAMNASLLASRGGGAPGWIAMPVAILFEWIAPAVEVVGYALAVVAFVMGWFSTYFAVLLLAAAFGLGVLLSVVTVLLDDVAFHVYRSWRDLFLLLGASVIENLGYRQLNAWWRLTGLIKRGRGSKGRWGVMTRRAVLHSAD